MSKSANDNSPAVRGEYFRADGSGVVRMTVLLPTDLAQATRLHAVSHGETYSSLVADALTAFLFGAE